MGRDVFSWFYKYSRKVFSIDTRSLAFFRICLALLILFDLSVRVKALVAHYTDFGVLSVGAFNEHYGNLYWWSIHLLSGSVWFQILLFSIAAGFAVLLLLGYYTRTAMFFSWILLISLQTRNPLVLQGGDIFLRVLAFWALFLPLGVKWSLDSRISNNSNEKKIFSFGTAGILLQIGMLYVFSAFLKSGTAWKDGSAVYLALSVDQFATHFGKWLLLQSGLTHFLTYAVYYFELIGPFLLFTPFFFGPIRTLFAFGFVILQAGMGLSLRLGPFPWISSVAMIVFLPMLFWESFVGRKIEILFNKLFSKNYNSQVYLSRKFKTDSNRNKVNKLFFITGNIIAAFFIVFIFLWNVQTLGHNTVPDNVEWIAFFTRTDQHWNMFAPYPLTEDGWYVLYGKLENGNVVNVFDESVPISFIKPEYVAALYPHERWRKYLMNLWNRDNASYRAYYLDYLCRDWNSKHAQNNQMSEIEMHFMLEKTLGDYQIEPIEDVLLLKKIC